MRLLIDFQACQGHTRGHGIGRYAFGLLKGMATIGALSDATLHVNATLGGLDDPLLREILTLSPQTRTVIQSYRPMDTSPQERVKNRILNTAAFSRLAEEFEGVLFLDPMEAGYSSFAPQDHSLFPTLWLGTVLYDFIPMLFPNPYLSAPLRKEDYFRKLSLLRESDCLLSISQHTKEDAERLLALSHSKIVNILGGVDGMFQDYSREETPIPYFDGEYILCAGNGEYRKNWEGMLNAYALLPPNLRRNYFLCFTGTFFDAFKETLLCQALDRGIDVKRIVLTGYVSDEELIALYSHCALFVFPSLYEGLGFPVLEAIRCGAPVIAGDNSSLPEVVGAPDALFNASDPADIAQKMEYALTHREWLDDLRARQTEHAKGFTWKRTAERAAEAIERSYAEFRAKQSASRRIVRDRRPRVALFSPFPPQRSGIANYNALLIPHLDRELKIDLVMDGTYALEAPELTTCHRVLSIDEFEAEQAHHPYDHRLFHLGNSDFHPYMLPSLVRHGGTVVLHEIVMEGLGFFALKKDLADHVGELFPALAPLVERQQMQIQALSPEARARFNAMLLLQGLELYMDGILMHSHFAKKMLLDLLPGLTLPIQNSSHGTVLPLLKKPHETNNLKLSLGLREGKIICGFFGIVHAHKGIEDIIDALMMCPLRKKLMAVFVGPCDELFQKKLKILSHNGIETLVTGELPDSLFFSYMEVCNFAFALRVHTKGESSGALAHLLSRGIPSIVSDFGPFSELPDQAVFKVPLSDTNALTHAITLLASDKDLRQRISTAARAYAETLHWPTRVEDYLEILEKSRRYREKVRRHVQELRGVEGAAEAYSIPIVPSY